MCTGLQFYGNSRADVKRKLGSLLKIKPVQIPEKGTFIGTCIFNILVMAGMKCIAYGTTLTFYRRMFCWKVKLRLPMNIVLELYM